MRHARIVAAVACVLLAPQALHAENSLTKLNDMLNSLSKGAGPEGNLVVNGGFEDPVVQKGGYSTYATGQSFGGWQVVGTGSVSPISGDYAQGGVRFNAHEGKQWLDMTGPMSNQAAGVQQTVKTEPGKAYELAFWVGNVSGGAWGTTSSVEVLVDGRSLGTAVNDKSQAGQLTWGLFKMPVTAAGASITLTFINRDPSSDNSNGLDAVSLVPTVGGSAAAAAATNLSGEYVYQGSGTATVSQIGDEVHMFFTWTPQGAGPHYEAKGKLQGDTITGEWYSLFKQKGWFRLVGKVLPNGDIDLSQSEDPINANIRKTVLKKR
jgi:hypothetical protein